MPSPPRDLWHHPTTLLPHRRTRQTRTFLCARRFTCFVFLPSLTSHLSPLHFNLSHCKQAIACVLSERPVGVDVESIGRYSESLARHVLSPEEFALVSSAPDPQIPFTRLWTQKEAVVKLTGRGIDDDLPNLLFKYNNVSLHTEEHLDKGYILSVATYKNF